jgi:hypothetical protein
MRMPSDPRRREQAKEQKRKDAGSGFWERLDPFRV